MLSDQVLVTITTCLRPAAIKAFVNDYITHTLAVQKSDLLVAIDGRCEKTESYLTSRGVAFICSDNRYGVGISKSRVLKAFPNYDYYFYIDDDVELVDSRIFETYISVAKFNEIHHMSAGPRARLQNLDSWRFVEPGCHLIEGTLGSGAFNFFTQVGLRTVGGWHESFAKYKRFGHTEHSYRFANAGLQKHAFVFVAECISGFIRTAEPTSVTRIKVDANENRIAIVEQEIIDLNLIYNPVIDFDDCIRPDQNNLAMNVDKLARLYKFRFYAGQVCLNLIRKLRSKLRS